MNVYTFKRNLSSICGLLDWKWRHVQPGLYIFNFHRIGDADRTLFDPNIFSADVSQFTTQIAIISNRFRVINIRELLQIVESAKEISEPLAMVTFDDGYEDNYSNSLPVLQAYNIPAVFFLPTDFIGNKEIPWWEEAAWVVRQSKNDAINLEGLKDPIYINKNDIRNVVRKVLRYFKDYGDKSIKEKMLELKNVCGVDQKFEGAASLFMSWEQVHELKQQGMDVGAHTCSHRILSHLNSEDQRMELSDSKTLIEQKLGSEIYTLAYPVGGDDTYSDQTIEIAKDCGYKLAFTFPKGGGISHRNVRDRFAIPRLSLEPQFTLPDIQFAVTHAARL